MKEYSCYPEKLADEIVSLKCLDNYTLDDGKNLFINLYSMASCFFVFPSLTRAMEKEKKEKKRIRATQNPREQPCQCLRLITQKVLAL